MANLYNEITDAVEDIRQLKSFIIFEGSKFINQIINSFSKDFSDFLKEKLKISATEFEAKEAPTKSMTIWEKIFRKKQESKPFQVMPVSSFTAERFKEIVNIIEEWNQKNNQKFSDEKFKILRLFAEKLTKIEENLLNIYTDVKNCEDLKGEKQLWHKKFKKLSKERKDFKIKPTTFEPKTEPVAGPTAPSEEEMKSISEKPKSRSKKTSYTSVPPSIPSPEEMDKLYFGKAEKLLEEIKSIFKSSNKIKDSYKDGFDSQIEKYKDKLLNNLKVFAADKQEDILINKIKNKVKLFEENGDIWNLIEIYDTIGLPRE